MSRDFITNILVLEDELSIMLNDLADDDPEAASDFFARFNFGTLYENNMFNET